MVRRLAGPDVSPPPELERHRAAHERLGRSYLNLVVRTMLEAPGSDALTVSLQTKLLKASMQEAGDSSDEIGLRLLDSFAD